MPTTVSEKAARASADLPYLGAYSPALRGQARSLIDQGRMGDLLRRKYREAHLVRSDKALYDYTQEFKQRHLRNAPPINKVLFDSKIQVVQHALGLHTAMSRIHGGRLMAKHEIRVASLFRQVPDEFLRMIVVHELAHLREKNHDKAFYQLCTHMEPDYHQYEFDLRLYMSYLDEGGEALWG